MTAHHKDRVDLQALLLPGLLTGVPCIVRTQADKFEVAALSTGQPLSQGWSSRCNSGILKRYNVSCVYWTVHHLDSWVKIDQLDATCIITTLFSAQHVSDVNTSILRSCRKLLRMDVLTSETCWALNKVVIIQVASSWSLFTQLQCLFKVCDALIELNLSIAVVSLNVSHLTSRIQYFLRFVDYSYA